MKNFFFCFFVFASILATIMTYKPENTMSFVYSDKEFVISYDVIGSAKNDASGRITNEKYFSIEKYEAHDISDIFYIGLSDIEYNDYFYSYEYSVFRLEARKNIDDICIEFEIIF